MNNEIHNQENLLLIGSRIKALKQKYPKNKGLEQMTIAFTEVCIYIAGLESREMELQLTLNKKKEKFKK